ncbi:ABC transporter permease [Sporosarcina limicola]|uniref:ABC-type transport system involved in multi-copper enzyme maturation permease subunit n=1 Tax=Sporosarcina limicola TaxID=34101 RepID=A0A927R3Q5_9BACL|nr:ABC transporter permease subunit [Sporosarcina limicola]MBE1555361.1 ABC-type transport system involved in multi-copper enzyme maturation permease subunit [Sporosarcina limicola]
MNMWMFELKKMWRRKQFLILALIAVACVTVIFLRNFWAQDEILGKVFQSMAPHSQSVYKIGKQFRNEMIHRSEDKAFMDAYDNARKMSTEFGKWQEAMRNKEWNHVPEAEMAFLQTVLKHIEWGGDYDGYPEDGLYQSFEKNKILLEHSLPYEDDLYSISTPNFMKIVFAFIVSIPALGIFVLLLGDQMVMEKENNTIRTLSTQPITKWRLLFGKFMGQLSAIVFALLVIFLACFAIPFFFGGQMGSFSYPQMIHLEDGFDFMPIDRYLFLHVLLFLGAASFLFSLVLLFSTVLKDRLSVLFFTLLALFGGVLLTNQFAALQSIINPFYYLGFQELIEQPNRLGNSLLIIIPYLYALLIVVISATLQKIKHTAEKGKKDVLPFKKGAISKTANRLFLVSAFEWRKYKREGVVKRFTVIILLLIVGGYAFIVFSTNQLREQYIPGMNASISFYKEMILGFEQIIEGSEALLEELEKKGTTPTSSEESLKEVAQSEVDGLGDAVSRYKNDVERRQKELAAYEQGDWKTVHESWIEEILLWWKDPNYMDNAPTERIGGGLSDFLFMASVQEKEWMIEHDLAAVHNNQSLAYTWSIYDKFISPLEQSKWNHNTRKVDKTGLFYVYTFFTTYSYFILAGLLIFLLGAGMTSEKGSKRTLTFLQTQPLTKSMIFLGKTGVSILLTASITLLSILFMVLIGTVSDRFGDWKFPILYYDLPSVADSANYTGFLAEEGGFHFIDMGRFLLETGALFLAGIVFLIAISLVVSLFFNNAMSVLLTTLIVAVGGYVVSTSSLLSSVVQWSPFTYLNAGKIANGETAVVLANESISTMSGLMALLVGTLIFICIGILYSRSRWMKMV